MHFECIYANTREGCKAKLQMLIKQMNAERQAARGRMRGFALEKLTNTQEKIWMYMKLHPCETNYSAIARDAKVTQHTVAKWYEMVREMVEIQEQAAPA